MRLRAALSHFSFSFSVLLFHFTSLTPAASAAISNTDASARQGELLVLTPDTFSSTTAHGLWFIEHFSPYCGHCKQFAPTWEKLVAYVDEKATTGELGMRLAQVNCAEHGDLCSAHGVTGYPQMNLYSDGKFIEIFKGDRSFDHLTDYLVKQEQKLGAPKAVGGTQSGSSDVLLNPQGAVLTLNPSTFDATLAQGPVFVKFYAPWCGHCKKLAPIWIQLAKHLQGKVNIAEVNCEDYDSICQTQNVKGFPMLAYYSHGTQTEYTGGRKFDQLKAFVEKASGPPVEAIKASELPSKLAENEVAFLLLHPESDHQALETVTAASSVLVGSAPVFSSTDPSLYTKYWLSPSSWVVLAFKHQTVAATYAPSTSASIAVTSTDLQRWLMTYRLPSALELTQDTFQSVMNAQHKPLVVIAAVSEENTERVSEKLVELGEKWVLRTNAAGTDGSRVVFTWMDGKRWEKWLKNMYGIKAESYATANGGNPQIVIADHQNLQYFDQDAHGQLLQLTGPQLFAAVEDALEGKSKARNSENSVERIARYVSAKLNIIESFVSRKPLLSLFYLAVFSVVVFLGLKKWLDADEIVREYGNGAQHHSGVNKAGRLD